MRIWSQWLKKNTFQYSTFVHDKNKAGIGETCVNIMKAIYDKSTANNIRWGKSRFTGICRENNTRINTVFAYSQL